MQDDNDDICVVCFTPKCNGFECLYIEDNDDSRLSELGQKYQEIFQLPILPGEPKQYVCGYCSTQIKLFHKFKKKAIDSYNLIAAVSCRLENEKKINEKNNCENTIVEEITVFDVVNEKTEMFKIQYLDNELRTSIELNDDNSSSNELRLPVHGIFDNNLSYEDSGLTYEQNEKIHKDNNMRKCEICLRLFWSEETYNTHMRIHTVNRALENLTSYTCTFCGKDFYKKSRLQIHLRIHSDERRYKCDICDKAFRSSSHLKYHRYSHFEKQFQCSICNQKYSTPRTLSDHLKFVHFKELPYQCDLCDRRFQRKNKMMEHRAVHTVHQNNYIIE